MLFRRERKVFHAVGIHVFIGRWHQSNAESCGNKTQDSLLLFSILRDDRHAAPFENIHCQVMAVTPGASFRQDNRLVPKVIDTDFIITDQPVMSGHGEHASFIGNKSRCQHGINVFRRAHKTTSSHPEMSRG